MPQNFPQSLRVCAQAGLLICLCAFLSNNNSLVIRAQQPTEAKTFLQKVRTFHSRAEFLQLTRGRVKISHTVPKYEQNYLQGFLGAPRLDWSEVTVIVRQGVPMICLGTNQGA
ncbi:MAG TPA: hypothetical protein VKG02_09050, partial [Blastocatellia bacterium]|nr:hypothetical protein [Blastocatellia bacterium]